MTEPPESPRAPRMTGVARFADVLPPRAHGRLLSAIIAREPAFVESSTGGADDYRRSSVVYDAERFAAPLLARVHALVPEACHRLGVAPLDAGVRVEMQLTAHNDGDFYKIHNDDDGPDAAARALTFVYYLHRRPRPFSGGELLVYERAGRRHIALGPGEAETVDPADNTLVLFPAGRLHEVLPVRCPTRAFADSRFTLNGWVWR